MYIYDNKGNEIKVGDRVRVFCPDDKNFYRKIGIVTLVGSPPHSDRLQVDADIFVQMVASGGGMWWDAENLRIQPPLKPYVQRVVHDQVGAVLTMGTRVSIRCPDNKDFYRKLGIITLIDTRSRRDASHRRAGEIFVQMVGSGGGMWWYGRFVKKIPTPRKRATKVELQINRKK